MDLSMVFNTVANHMLKQYAQSRHAEEGQPAKLMYRTPSGLADPIGCLIPKNMYHPDMEGYAFKGPSTWKQWTNNDGLEKLRVALTRSGIDTHDEMVMRLLTDLQQVHDTHEPKFWYDRLIATARTWRFSTRGIESAARDYGRLNNRE